MKHLIHSILFILSLFSFYTLISVPIRISTEGVKIGIMGNIVNSSFLILSIIILIYALEYYMYDGIILKKERTSFSHYKSYNLLLLLGILYVIVYLYLLFSNDSIITNKHNFIFIGLFVIFTSRLIKVKHNFNNLKREERAGSVPFARNLL